MRTVYGKLIALIFATLAALMLFLPMRFGLEDHLYAYPRALRMAKGDVYPITCELDADRAQTIQYISKDESVATVSAKGEVSAVNPGSTDIHMSAEGGAKTTVHVEVVGTPPTELTLNASSVYLEKGQVTSLTASFNEGADDTRVEWRSEDNRIARVDTTGHIKALRGGETRVYALAPNGLRADTRVFVHVSGDAMRITPEELTVGTGAVIQMGTSYFPEDTTDPVVRWITSDKNLMTVDSHGVIQAVGVGRPVLTAVTQEGLNASTIINIEPSAESFDLSPSAVTIERGVALDIEPRFFDADGNLDIAPNNHYMEWKSSNPDVVSVADGHVVGLSSGEALITATADGMTAACTMRVQVLVHEITLNQSEVWLLKEDAANPIQLTARIQPSDPDDPTITWTSNNEMVANVNENGLVTMTGGYGTAIISAKASSGAEARFVVNVVVKLPDPEDSAAAVDGAQASMYNAMGGFNYDETDAAAAQNPPEELVFD